MVGSQTVENRWRHHFKYHLSDRLFGRCSRFGAANVAEYGIVASLIITAIALWTKSNRILPIAAALLASFHGMAHGVELAHAGHIVALVTGMVAGMALIYCGGLVLGAVFTRYVPYGKKIVGACAALVAVIGLS